MEPSEFWDRVHKLGRKSPIAKELINIFLGHEIENKDLVLLTIFGAAKVLITKRTQIEEVK